MLRKINLFLTGLVISAATLVFSHTTRAQTYNDNNFNNGNWTASLVPGSIGSFSSSQDTSAGTPRPSRKTIHVFGQGAIQVAHLRNGAVYVPTNSGPIASINYRYNLRHYSSTGGQQVAYSLLIEQNNSFYATSNDLITLNAWQTFSHMNLTASMFTRISGTGPINPDFSCTGARIQFGFRSANSNPNPNTTSTRTSGIDNWSVTINTAPFPPIQNPNFDLTATLLANSLLYQLEATSPPLPGANFRWHVQEIDLVTGIGIPGTEFSNPMWDNISSNNFFGYVGDSTGGNSNPGDFQQGHKYRISLTGVFPPCYQRQIVSKTVFMCENCY